MEENDNIYKNQFMTQINEERKTSNKLSGSLKEAIEVLIQNEMMVLQKMIRRVSKEEDRHNELSRKL
jgi:hypothetical protein